MPLPPPIMSLSRLTDWADDGLVRCRTVKPGRALGEGAVGGGGAGVSTHVPPVQGRHQSGSQLNWHCIVETGLGHRTPGGCRILKAPLESSMELHAIEIRNHHPTLPNIGHTLRQAQTG